MAHAMGADFIEQDVVLTKNNIPVVLHDIYLDTVTNVAQVFPKRVHTDGRFYAINFTLKEIKRLRVNERINLKTKKAVFDKRFPVGKADFRVPTLAEEIELIQGLNKSTGRNVGIYTEIKKPEWHRSRGKDISRIVLNVLARYGYEDKTDRVYVQCFDARETKRMRFELKTKLKLVQLIAENDWNEAPSDFDFLRTTEGIQSIAEYADGIGPWLKHVCQGPDESGKLIITALVADAHEHGLEVHPYTFRTDRLPDYADSFDFLLGVFFEQAKVDGVFTDFPDRAVNYLRKAGRRK